MQKRMKITIGSVLAELKSRHGGARVGAGRPVHPDAVKAVVLSIRLSQQAVGKLDADRCDMSRARYIEKKIMQE